MMDEMLKSRKQVAGKTVKAAPPKSAPPVLEIAEAGIHAPRDAVRAAFSSRIQALLLRRGWSQSELARRVEQQLPEGHKFGRDNINNYIRKGTLPSPVHLAAICKALGVERDDLLPNRGYPSIDEEHPPLNVRDMNDGSGWLRVNQRVTWPKLVKILEILKDNPVEKTTKE